MTTPFLASSDRTSIDLVSQTCGGPPMGRERSSKRRPKG